MPAQELLKFLRHVHLCLVLCWWLHRAPCRGCWACYRLHAWDLALTEEGCIWDGHSLALSGSPTPRKDTVILWASRRWTRGDVQTCLWVLPYWAGAGCARLLHSAAEDQVEQSEGGFVLFCAFFRSSLFFFFRFLGRDSSPYGSSFMVPNLSFFPGK